MLKNMTKEEILIEQMDIDGVNYEYKRWIDDGWILPTFEKAMERYANQRTNELQAKILSFRQSFKVNEHLHHPLLQIIDKHFGITDEK